MRGKVLEQADGTTTGTILGDDARRYRYTLPDLCGPAPAAGQEVMFDISGNAARNLHAVAEIGQGARLLERNWIAFYLSTRGRISRLEYWLFGVLALLFSGLLLNVVLGAMPVSEEIAILASIAGSILNFAFGWAWIAITVKRFHDRGLSGWWTLTPYALMLLGAALFLTTAWSPGTTLAFVTVRLAKLSAFAALAAIVHALAWVLVWRGQRGDDRVGPDPLRYAARAFGCPANDLAGMAGREKALRDR